MLEGLIAFGVVAIVVLMSEAASERGFTAFGRVVHVVGETIWRIWLLLIAATIVTGAMVVTFDVTGRLFAMWIAGLVALVAVVALAWWLFDWRFPEWGWRSERTLRRYAIERQIEDAHSRGWEALKRRRFEQSASAYREAAELGDADAMVNLANILADESGLPDEAERWYSDAIEAGHTTAAVNLGLLRLHQGRVEEARELFDQARRSGDTEGYVRLAEVAVEEGELERAQGLLEIAVMENDLEAYAPLGDVLARMGREDDAERRLREGLALGARDVTLVLVDVLRAVGRDDEADELCAGRDVEDAERWPPE